MREIKFRAWDNVENEMLYCGENVEVLFMLGSAGIECTDIRNVSPDGHDVFKEHLNYMQYTGLKDKNGKEIYEGDILESISELLTNLGKTRTGKFHTSYYKVIWKDDGWGYEVIENNGKGLVNGYQNKGLLIQTSYAKVIGNIFENPNCWRIEYVESNFS